MEKNDAGLFNDGKTRWTHDIHTSAHLPQKELKAARPLGNFSVAHGIHHHPL